MLQGCSGELQGMVMLCDCTALCDESSCWAVHLVCWRLSAVKVSVASPPTYSWMCCCRLPKPACTQEEQQPASKRQKLHRTTLRAGPTVKQTQQQAAAGTSEVGGCNPVQADSCCSQGCQDQQGWYVSGIATSGTGCVWFLRKVAAVVAWPACRCSSCAMRPPLARAWTLPAPRAAQLYMQQQRLAVLTACGCC